MRYTIWKTKNDQIGQSLDIRAEMRKRQEGSRQKRKESSIHSEAACSFCFSPICRFSLLTAFGGVALWLQGSDSPSLLVSTYILLLSLSSRHSNPGRVHCCFPKSDVLLASIKSEDQKHLSSQPGCLAIGKLRHEEPQYLFSFFLRNRGPLWLG